MAKFTFSIGTRMILHEREVRIEVQLADGRWRLRDVATDSTSLASTTELNAAYTAGRLRALLEHHAAESVPRKTPKNLKLDFTRLPKDLRREASRRYQYVKAAKGLPWTVSNPEILNPIILAVCKKTKDPSPPAPITLYRWRRDFAAAGEDIRGLVSNPGGKGSRESRTQPEVDSIIETAIREVYLRPELPSVADLYNSIKRKIDGCNEHRRRSDPEWLRTPSVVTIYNRVKRASERDPFEFDRARYGQKYAELVHRVAGAGTRSHWPLDRVEIDHTKLDLFVVDDETRLPIGRPWLTTAIDHRTKAVLGYYLSFTPPSYLSVMKCVKHAILPKTYLRERYPRVHHDWEMFGVFSTLVVDNGKEFLSADLEAALWQIGIDTDFSPVKIPWYKATVESHFRTVNLELLKGKPGTTFSNVFERGDYDPNANAIISLSALNEMIHIWIVDIYLRKPNRGVKGIPAKLWAAGVADFAPALPECIEDLNVLMGHTAERKILKNAVTWKTLVYRSPRLKTIERHLGDKMATLRFDPDDIGTVYVLDPLTEHFHPIPAVGQSYAAGLSIWQHNVIRAFALREAKEEAEIDLIALLEAKATIERIVEEERFLTKGKSGARQKIARWRGEGKTSLPKAYPGDLRPVKSAAATPKIAGGHGRTAWKGISDVGESGETSTLPSEETAVQPSIPRGKIVLAKDIPRGSSKTRPPTSIQITVQIPSNNAPTPSFHQSTGSSDEWEAVYEAD